jgi:hypothetical protein
VAGVALNPIEATAVNSHYRTLHVYEIVLAQTASNPFVFLDKHCATLSRLQARADGLRASDVGLQHEKPQQNGSNPAEDLKREAWTLKSITVP